MRLESVKVGDLWSFGEKPAIELREFGDISVIIGRNNVGKSNVLRVLNVIRSTFRSIGNNKHVDWHFGPNDLHLGPQDYIPKPKLTATFRLNGSELVVAAQQHNIPTAFREVLKPFIEKGGSMLLDIRSQPMDELLPQRGMRMIPSIRAEGAPNPFDPTIAGPQIHVPAWLASYAASCLVEIPAWRRLNEKPAQQEEDFIRALHRCQGAKPEERKLREVFRRVEDFFRRLTGLTNANLQPQADGTALSVEWNGRYLPIGSFGAGFSHLLMLSFESARSDRQVIIVEEPETGLHPQLQRQLLGFIREELLNKSGQGNQYVLTTHSPVMLDAGRAGAVFLVTYDGDRSAIHRARASMELYRVLDELDIRASDLLQANSVIWVEGPSDRVLLKQCLQLVAPDVAEGIDYQIVCYGGALRSHLTIGSDDEMLINILRLSRSVAMVADSDRSSNDEALAGAKLRLERECRSIGGYSWVTDGREIENYLSPRVLQATFSRLLGREVKIELGEFDRIGTVLAAAVPDVKHGEAQWVRYDDNKPHVMIEIAKDLSVQDLEYRGLRERIDGLVQHLRKARPVLVPHATS